MKDAPVQHHVEYSLYLLVRGLLRLFPHRAARPLGRRLGGLAYLLDARHRRVALGNLALALPELSAAERRRLARDCFRFFGAAAFDTLSSARFDLVGLCRRLTLEGWEHLQSAESEGRGLFVLSAHLGMWEIAAYPPGIYGGPLHVVGRPLDNPHLNRELMTIRGRFGNVMIPKRGAARGMIRALRRRERVGILIDQRVPPNEAIEVPFFGRPALTSPLLARLSLSSSAPVVPIFAFPEPEGRYRFVARPAIHPPPEPAKSDQERAVYALTRRYLEATEDEIRQRPEMWLWMHRRWKGAGESRAEEPAP